MNMIGFLAFLQVLRPIVVWLVIPIVGVGSRVVTVTLLIMPVSRCLLGLLA